MRHLFTLNQKGDVDVDPAALSIAVYKKIWDRDKSPVKKRAIKELGYVYYMCDFKSFLSDITDLNEKHNEVAAMVFEGPYTPDKVILEAMEIYKKDIPFSVAVLEDAKVGINALREYFKEVNLVEVDDKGKPIHDASKLTNSLKSLSGLISTLEELEQKVKRDLDISNTVRGGREKGIFEDPDNNI